MFWGGTGIVSVEPTAAAIVGVEIVGLSQAKAVQSHVAETT